MKLGLCSFAYVVNFLVLLSCVCASLLLIQLQLLLLSIIF